MRKFLLGIILVAITPLLFAQKTQSEITDINVGELKKTMAAQTQPKVSYRNDMINIECENLRRVQVYSMLGKEVFKSEEPVYEINTSKWFRSYYLVKLTTLTGEKVLKVTVK